MANYKDQFSEEPSQNHIDSAIKDLQKKAEPWRSRMDASNKDSDEDAPSNSKTKDKKDDKSQELPEISSRSSRSRVRASKKTELNVEVIEVRRITRSMTRRLREQEEEKTKNKSSNSPESAQQQENNEDQDVSGKTVYEDAVENAEKPHSSKSVNSTFVVKQPIIQVNAPTPPASSLDILDQTSNVKKEKAPINQHQTANDLVTNDDINENETVPKKDEQNAHYISPKKKIEGTPKQIGEHKGAIKKTTKYFTQSKSDILNAPSTSKDNKVTTPIERSRFLSTQALEKRAMSEDRNKKHKDRVARIKQQKEAFEEEQRKLLVAKLKEEKEKAEKRTREKEEQLKLLKEEKERKGQLAKKRAEEMRKLKERKVEEKGAPRNLEQKRFREDKIPK